MYCPPNSQFVFSEKARPAGCWSVLVIPSTTASSGSAATPAPPIKPACSSVRRETRRPIPVARSPGCSSVPVPGRSPPASTGPSGSGASTGPSGGDASPRPPSLSPFGRACGPGPAGLSAALIRPAADPTRLTAEAAQPALRYRAVQTSAVPVGVLTSAGFSGPMASAGRAGALTSAGPGAGPSDASAVGSGSVGAVSSGFPPDGGAAPTSAPASASGRPGAASASVSPPPPRSASALALSPCSSGGTVP